MPVLADAAALTALAARAHEHGRLAIDTEFMGEGRYRALLCLVQIAVPGPDGDLDEVTIEVVDPLDDALDPSPLAAALADPSVEVVMHAARQDVALLRRTWATEITSLFDTQLAAGFAGLRAQMGYERHALGGPGGAPGQVGQLHPLGRAAAERRAGRLRAR